MLLALRFRFLALITSVMLVAAAGPAWGQNNILAQYDLGLLTGDTSTGLDNSGRSGASQGWGVYLSDPNVTAKDIALSDSIPPSSENYIEITNPPYLDANGNQFPVLRLQGGNNSRGPFEAVTKDKYFTFTVTAENGTALNLSGSAKGF
jgi:hypothetical protein